MPRGAGGAKNWKGGLEVPEANSAIKTGLSHTLRAPARMESGSCKHGFKHSRCMKSPESWARAQVTTHGKPGTEAFNRPHVWISELCGALETLNMLRTEYGDADSPTQLLGAAASYFSSDSSHPPSPHHDHQNCADRFHTCSPSPTCKRSVPIVHPTVHSFMLLDPCLQKVQAQATRCV